MRHIPMRRQVLVAGTAALLAISQSALADEYPSKPIKIIVGFPPGGFTDALARIVGQRLQTKFGVPVVIENKAGATGTIGADMVAKSQADGYTLLMGHFASNAVAQALFPRLPYHVLRDFTPVVRLASTPMLLVVNHAVPVSDVKGLIDYAVKHPDELSFASSGNGTAQHLAAVQFTQATGTRMTHVPYRGSGPAMTDLLSGQVHLNFESPPNVIPQLKSGKLKVLGVTSSKRLASLPDVPTLSSAGVPNFEMTQWFGVFGPRGLPKPITDKLNAEINTILKTQEVIDQISAQGGDVIGGSSDSFAAFLKQDVAKWETLIKTAGIKLD